MGRKLVLGVGLAALFAGIGFVFWPGAEKSSSSGGPSGTRQGGAAAGTPAAKDLRYLVPAPAVQADGQVEVQVREGGRPVAGADVRLYWYAGRDLGTGAIDWQASGNGTTDSTGRVSLPVTHVGGYLLSVRADRFAPARRELARSAGEAVTRVEVELQTTVSVRGRVVSKGNGEPVPQAEVSLVALEGVGDPWGYPSVPDEEKAVAVSDGRGLFRLDGLAPGHYRLEARAVGYARAAQRTVVLPAPSDLDIEMIGAGVIEGFVTGADGQPAAGAEVTLATGDEAATVTVAAGSGGGFSAEVQPGSYVVFARRGEEAGSLPGRVAVGAGGTVRDVQIRIGAEARIEGLVMAASSGKPISGAWVIASPSSARASAGRASTDGSGNYRVGGLAPGTYDVVAMAQGFSEQVERGITITAGQRFPLTLKLTGTGEIEGTVKDGSGKPVSNVTVETGRRMLLSERDSARNVTRTNDEGHYRLANVPAGDEILITARREGDALGLTDAVAVVEGQVAKLDFTLDDTGELVGMVHRKSGGPPDRPAMVQALPRGNLAVPGSVGLAAVDATGAFHMVLAAGTYGLAARYVDASGLPAATTPITIETGRRADVSLTLEDGRPEGISGVVVEPGGGPSSGALVFYNGSAGGTGAVTFQADLDGRFVLPKLPDVATVDIRARNGGRMGESKGIGWDSGQVTIQLQPGASLRGRILSHGGAPVTGFTLRVVSHDEAGPWPTSELVRQFTGDSYELSDVPGEAVKISAKTADGRTGEASTTLAPGGSAQLDVTLEDGGKIAGRVIDVKSRASLADATVMLDDGRTVTTAGDGRFRLEVGAGERWVRIWAPRHEVVQQAATVSPGQTLDLGEIALGAPHVPPGNIGANLAAIGGKVTVSWLTPGGPAEVVGMRVGDVLVSVDGIPTSELRRAVDQVRGASGSLVVIVITRGGVEQTFKVTRG